MKIRTPPIIPEESLSSWIVRSSLLNGCDLLTLSWKIWGKYRALTIDFERNMSVAHIGKLSEETGRPYSEIDGLLLIHHVQQHTTELNTSSTIWPWMIPIGIHYRNRLIGQPFCPQCFQKGIPHLRREWRMAWATVCTKHYILLQDRCPECRFLYSPTKLTGFEKKMTFCHHCNHDMRENPIEPAFSVIQHAVEQNKLYCFGHKNDMPTWLLTLNNVICLIRRASLAPNGCISAMLHDLELLQLPEPSETGGTFEWLPIRERHALLRAAACVIHQPMSSLIQVAQKNRITKNTLRNTLQRDFSPVFVELYDRLLVSERASGSKPKHNCPRSEKAVMRKWARLERKIQRVIAS
ncbi:TniQ family protein [Eikenella corrodens]|uniref:TniQ family protein n=1 Tax=Eikenella corrodens TaxID=539 RepID=UPI0009BF9D2D|nr:TniQ family protein [Eikenella corrodens]